MTQIVFDIEKLREASIDQFGFITTAQAARASVSRASLAVLVRRNRLQRVARGIYRVPQSEPTVHDRFMIALLWTGCDEAVLSHETALESYEVCDVNPVGIHVAVGKSRRLRRAGGEGYTIHREDISAEKRDQWEGAPRVKLAVAIEQCIRTGTASYLLDQAIENGRKRGLISRSDAERLSRLIEVRDNGSNTGLPSRAARKNEGPRKASAQHRRA